MSWSNFPRASEAMYCAVGKKLIDQLLNMGVIKSLTQQNILQNLIKINIKNIQQRQ